MSKVNQIILIIGSMMIVVGIVLMGWLLATKNQRDVIEIKLEDGETESLTFENLALIPGEECEYAVQLKKAGADQFQLMLNFVETEEKTLKNYARMKIIANGEIIRDELLATVFQSDPIVLPVDFDEEKNTELKIVYYLPIEVGNEAKNAEAVFELQLTASNE